MTAGETLHVRSNAWMDASLKVMAGFRYSMFISAALNLTFLFVLCYFSWDVTWGISGTAQIYMLGDGTEGVCMMYIVSELGRL